ncbi:nascent polypeptide-associated complex protein [Candidatus Thorarchaeota archaeon]|nr:MAG: nascent polypeptide-associated complex protein [Candidatus Thorarchaeota archaeon]
MGFRGYSPKQMERMMKKMGIEQKDIDDVREVIIRFSDKEWVISKPSVTMVKQGGVETYQISGSKTERKSAKTVTDAKSNDRIKEEPIIEIPIEDAALVASQTGVDIETAKQALKETEGDLAAAILKLRH